MECLLLHRMYLKTVHFQGKKKQMKIIYKDFNNGF